MELYVGGSSQGKLQYVLQKHNLSETQVVNGAHCTREDIIDAKVINHFHLYLRRLLEQGQHDIILLEQLFAALKDSLIIMDEVGCGIVPMDAFERLYREQVGRVGCQLAQKASHVERISCGIGRVLK